MRAAFSNSCHKSNCLLSSSSVWSCSTETRNRFRAISKPWLKEGFTTIPQDRAAIEKDGFSGRFGTEEGPGGSVSQQRHGDSFWKALG